VFGAKKGPTTSTNNPANGLTSQRTRRTDSSSNFGAPLFSGNLSVTNAKLLRRYAKQRQEIAFTALVRRHDAMEWAFAGVFWRMRTKWKKCSWRRS
jgi:hypothetical protein